MVLRAKCVISSTGPWSGVFKTDNTSNLRAVLFTLGCGNKMDSIEIKHESVDILIKCYKKGTLFYHFLRRHNTSYNITLLDRLPFVLFCFTVHSNCVFPSLFTRIKIEENTTHQLKLNEFKMLRNWPNIAKTLTLALKSQPNNLRLTIRLWHTWTPVLLYKSDCFHMEKPCQAFSRYQSSYIPVLILIFSKYLYWPHFIVSSRRFMSD